MTMMLGRLVSAGAAHARAVSTLAAKATQQNKMKSCNADATTKGLKGAERKKFMSECLTS